MAAPSEEVVRKANMGKIDNEKDTTRVDAESEQSESSEQAKFPKPGLPLKRRKLKKSKSWSIKSRMEPRGQRKV